MRKLILNTIIVAMVIAAGYSTSAVAAGTNYAGATVLSQAGINYFSAISYDPFLRSQLALSEEQAGAIGDLLLEHTKNMIRTESEARILNIELNDLLAAEEPNSKAIEKKIDEIGAVNAEMHKSVIRTMIKACAQLTETQLDKVEILMTRRPPR